MKLIFAALFAISLYSQMTLAKPPRPPEKPKCQLSYVTKSDLSDFRAKGTPISSLSRSVNKILKTSFDFLNKLDRYTLGIASSLTLGAALGTHVTLEDIKPNQWNQVTLIGRLVYRDSPFSIVPLKATKIDIEYKKKKETLITGAKGEYTGYFYKWVPFTQVRIFLGPDFFSNNLNSSDQRISNQRLVKTVDTPFTIKVRSKFCHASTTITQLPLEPITFILSSIKK